MFLLRAGTANEPIEFPHSKAKDSVVEATASMHSKTITLGLRGDNHIEVRQNNPIEAQGRCNWNAPNSSLRYIDTIKELTLCFDQNS